MSKYYLNESQFNEVNNCIEDLQMFAQLLANINPDTEIPSFACQTTGKKLQALADKLIYLTVDSVKVSEN